MFSQDTWLLLKSSFSINSPQILFPFSKNYVSFSVLKIIREVKTSANLKSGDFLFVVPHYPPPLKPTTPHKTLTPACVSQDRKQKKWKEVDYGVWRGFFNYGLYFYWNSYQIRQFPFQVDLSTFDKIVIFGVSEMVNVFNNTSVPI